MDAKLLRSAYIRVSFYVQWYLALYWFLIVGRGLILSDINSLPQDLLQRNRSDVKCVKTSRVVATEISMLSLNSSWSVMYQEPQIATVFCIAH